MADGDTKHPLSASPTEDFNPLAENLKQLGHDADCSESGEDDVDSQCNSIDDQFAPMYSITPPASARGLKLEKKKQQSHVQKSTYKQYVETRKIKKGHLRGPISVIKERYADDPVFCKLSGVDSDDNLERHFVAGDDKEKKNLENRESKKKSMKNSRAHERLAKRSSSDLAALDTNTAEVPLPLNPVRVDTSGKFSSLGLKSSPLALSGSFSASFGSRSVDFRRQSVWNIDVPKERLEFYKIFSTLINLGSQNKKEKEGKSAKDRLMSSYRRQVSSEQEMWAERWKEYLWMELQMEQNGFNSFQMQEDYLKCQREKIPEVLDEITNFKLDYIIYSDQKESANPKCDNDLDRSKEVCETASNEALYEVDSFSSINLTQGTIMRQRDALKHVGKLLSKLDECEQLFPTSNAFAKEYSKYGEEEFVQQVKSLYLWQNITRDLCHKMKLLSKMLGIQDLLEMDLDLLEESDPKTTQSVHSLHRLSIPEIQEPSESMVGMDSTDDELEDSVSVSISTPTSDDTKQSPNGNTKKVTFTIDSCRSSRDTSPVSVPLTSSTPVKSQSRVVSSSNLSRASSEASLEDFDKTSRYRKYVDKTLKRMGMNKMLLRFKDLLERTLQRAREALQQLKHATGNDSKSSEVDFTVQMSSSPALDLNIPEFGSGVTSFHRSSSLTDCGAWWGRQFIQMGLPSFRPSYLFLLQVFMDVIHEALRLRLEQRPNNNPSVLSIRPLLRECKEVLRGAVIVKQYYQTMVDSVISEDELASYEEKSAGELDQFDDDMRKMLEIYFTYLQSWLIALQNLPEASLSLKNVLEQEWVFTKQICPHVIGGEAEAGKRFSMLASSLLNSIEYFLETGIDDFTTSLYNWTMQEEEEEEDQSEQGDVDQDFNNNEELEDDNEEQEQQKQREKELRHSFQQTSRNCKKLFNEARERASKALGFAKTLRKDLEIAADFNIAVTTVELLAKLKTTNHVQVIASNDPGYLMFIPERIMNNRQLILQLLNVTCGREDLTGSQDVAHKEEGYLLMVCCEGGKDHVPECPLWYGQQVQVEPTAETAIALSHLQVEGLLLVVIHSSQLMTQRKDFEDAMGKTVVLINEQTSCHQAIAESLTELKSSAMELQERVVQAIKQVDEKFYFEDIAKLDDGERNHLLNLYRETMLKGYNFGFEYLREVTRLVSGEPRMKLGKRLVEFARDWMSFVTAKCEKGRGMRPKWASQGFDFLIVACEPKVLACLTDEEFQELKRSINNCISHVIGSAERNTPVSPTHGNIHIPRSSSVDSGRQPYQRYPSWPAEQPGKYSRSSSNISSKSTSSEPAMTPVSVGADSRYKRHSLESHSKVELHEGEDGGIILDIHRQRSRAGSSDLGNPLGSHLKPLEKRKRAVAEIERNREHMLRDGFLIGRLTSHKAEPDYRISARRVNFRWQRGTKIGEGQFGKVYSAVNMDTGELMAMKEMKFRPNDHQALKVIADEIIMFEGIRHPNLVMYYGVEVHRDEMLVFMEYCDRGTLEEAAKMGLREHNIRIYTREILKATNHLHENNIVHRDIKGANIFLTSSGCLKLGDFGCSVKLKSHATMPGEFNNLVGTMAYMAPEVITNDKEGHGRAADIWSLGCVVIEMTTGKRPWHELDNNAQIMFKVGMGGKPAIPELSEEGKDFLSNCFQFDPNNRMTAGELLDHAFVMIDEEGET